MAVLERLGLENFEGLRADLDAHGIDCDFEPTGELLALTDAYQQPWIDEERESLERFGHEVTVLDGDGDARRGRLADLHRRGVGPHGRGHPRPGQAGRGLRDAALRAGVRVFEHTAVHDLRRPGRSSRR